MLNQKSLELAIADYLDNYSIEANLSPKTVRNKREILKRLPPFLKDKSFDLNSCREFLAHLYKNGWKTPNSRLDLVRVMRAFVNFLFKHKYIEENFAILLVKPKVPQKEFDYVDPKQ